MDMLIVMAGLKSGGAEKSLVSLLTAIDVYYGSSINVDLLVFRPEGIFMDQIPDKVHWISEPKEVFCMSYPPQSTFFKVNVSLAGIAGKFAHIFLDKVGKKDGLNENQRMWKHWRTFIPRINKQYDVAISYIQGEPNYFLVDKVSAKKKYVYIHHEYEKLEADARFDEEYFMKTDGVITVSEKCVQSIERALPPLKGKVYSIENIVSYRTILSMAEKGSADEFVGSEGIRILSIGRLSEVKRFDRAIEAAHILKEKGLKFKWVLVGEGSLKNELKKQIIEAGLENYFVLAGVKNNPYPYILNTDIFVQTSDTEGKSIVIDEAKILDKPVIVTNYMTVREAIENEYDGLIVDFTPDAVAQAILRIVNDPKLREQIISNLRQEKKGNEEEVIEKYRKLWE